MVDCLLEAEDAFGFAEGFQAAGVRGFCEGLYEGAEEIGQVFVLAEELLVVAQPFEVHLGESIWEIGRVLAAEVEEEILFGEEIDEEGL